MSRKPYTRIKGKICDIRRFGDDCYVRVEIIDLVKELGEWMYLVRYLDGGVKAMISPSAIGEISEVKDLKPNLCAVIPIRGKKHAARR